jgi:hypothetical protein
MRSRALRFLVLLSLVLLAGSTFAQRRRAVRVPSPNCTYSLSFSMPDPVSDAGLARSRVSVTPSSPSQCAGWAAFADVPWISVETSADEGASFITILPNTTSQPRVGHVRIGGTTFVITQVAASEPPDDNLLKNGKFNVDLANWGWPARFPNGTGDASWSSLDANNSMTSGSMRLRDDISSGPAYQQLQCVNLTSGTFDYGFAARISNTNTFAVEPVMAFVQFQEPNCNGNYLPYFPATTRVTRPNEWQRFWFSNVISPGTQSVGLIVAAWARNAGVQEVWFDDVFLRPRAF